MSLANQTDPPAKFGKQIEQNQSSACVLSHVWLCDPMNYIPLGSSAHEIFQARILEWVTVSFSWGSSWSGDLPDPGIKLESPESPALQDSLLPSHWGSSTRAAPWRQITLPEWTQFTKSTDPTVICLLSPGLLVHFIRTTYFSHPTKGKKTLSFMTVVTDISESEFGLRLWMTKQSLYNNSKIILDEPQMNQLNYSYEVFSIL